MIYYLLIILSVIMFGANFAMQDVYRKKRGSCGIKVSMEATVFGALFGIIVLLIFSKFRIEFSLFTLIMATITAINTVACTWFVFKTLDKINLSLFSVFTMLGGMVLPFAQGIIFYGESITVAKVVCVVLICIALAFTVTRDEQKGGYVYYAGVFILNGLSGVITKLFNELPYEKTSALSFSLWWTLTTLLISVVILLIVSRKKEDTLKKNTLGAITIVGVGGAINKVASFILVYALVFVDASVQYPMVTGGVMIVSTLFCYFGDRKPSRKELISVAISFLGMLALFLIPV